MVFAFVGGAVVGSRRSVGFAVCRDRGVERRGNIRMMDGGERSSAEKMVQRMREMARKDIELENARGLIPSHRTVRRDENGEPLMERFVYVDEIDCIGCSHCAMTARNTFFLEEEFGRARAFRQDADPVGLIEEAIDTCPVNCIYYVPYEELQILELEREGQDINPTARLVGAASNERRPTKSKVLASRAIRCENCPQRGCKACPLYGVGENPNYTNRVAKKKAKREAKKQTDDESRRIIL